MCYSMDQLMHHMHVLACNIMEIESLCGAASHSHSEGVTQGIASPATHTMRLKPIPKPGYPAMIIGDHLLHASGLSFTFQKHPKVD